MKIIAGHAVDGVLLVQLKKEGARHAVATTALLWPGGDFVGFNDNRFLSFNLRAYRSSVPHIRAAICYTACYLHYYSSDSYLFQRHV
jgi:hypothetical protein